MVSPHRGTFVADITITDLAQIQEIRLALDHRFHRLLAASAHNKFLAPEVEMLYNLSLRIWHMYMSQIKPTDLMLGAFTEILSAIESRDAASAEKAMQQHIRQFGESVKAYL